MVELSFASGTIEVRGLAESEDALGETCAWDARTRCFRAPAVAYAEIVRALIAAKIPYDDHARRYEALEDLRASMHAPREYQKEAIEAWNKARGRGVIVLPTGAGKTLVACVAIDRKKRASLVIAPTLDLVRQWYDLLRDAFGREVGVVGGGEHEVRPLTVTTYDSAYLHMEHLGARFGLVVFDECHHLPSGSFSLAARQCLAPYRLGLTATPERADGKEIELAALIGPVVYRRDIVDLSGAFLSEYDVVRRVVELTEDERAEYEAERAVYRAFIERMGIQIGSPQGWSDFIIRASRTEEGRTAMRAYRRQRELAFAASRKFEVCGELLHRHRADRTIVFTEENAAAYAISRRFLIPAITHQTKVRERSEILSRLSDGSYRAVVTSKVLNEGVDVPDANVAIVLSGSGSVREHVQRLGRVLRKRAGKRAILYEVVSAKTGETFTSERRRDHVAYR